MKLKCLTAALFLLAVVPALAIDVNNPPKGVFADDWYAVMIDGRKSGHMRSMLERKGDIIRSATTMQMTAGRGQTTITVTVTQESEETLDGKPLAFSNTMRLGMIPTSTKGQIKDGKVTITTSQFGQKGQTATYDLPDGAKMSWGVFREEIERGLTPGTRYEISMYEPTMAADRLTPATIEILEKETIDLFGRKVQAIRSRQTMKVKALLGREIEMTTTSWLEDDGTPVKVQMELMNIPVEMVACTKTIALSKDDPADIMDRTLVTLEGRLDEFDADAPQQRYRITARGNGDGQRLELPETGMQKVERRSTDSLDVTVTRLSARKSRPAARPLTADERKLYLAPAPLVNYEDPPVKALAREAAGDEKDPRKLAARLRRFVAEYIQAKSLSVGFASAGEVARSKEGDCTEHGVLLAALGRANGIPTRIVTGLVHADEFNARNNVFVGHLWTQFYLDGEWVDVDAALPQAEPDATHIAMDLNAAADTGMADMVGSLWLTMGNLRIEAIGNATSQSAP